MMRNRPKSAKSIMGVGHSVVKIYFPFPLIFFPQHIFEALFMF